MQPKETGEVVSDLESNIIKKKPCQQNEEEVTENLLSGENYFRTKVTL